MILLVLLRLGMARAAVVACCEVSDASTPYLAGGRSSDRDGDPD